MEVISKCYGNDFYHGTLKRYVAAFGTLFNDLVITRYDNSNGLVQTIKVPIQYGPKQKFLAKLRQDPTHEAPAITLPRLSFETVGFSYDGERKTAGKDIMKKITTANNVTVAHTFKPIPYNIDFELNIMVKNLEDGNKIIEQILPYFRPDWTSTIEILDGLDIAVDVPLSLIGVAQQDTYEGDFETRRALLWTLTFSMKAWFFGPAITRKVIKFANTNLYTSMTANTVAENVYVQPGLTANGEPTSILAESVDLDLIGPDDDYGFVVIITNVEDD